MYYLTINGVPTGQPMRLKEVKGICERMKDVILGLDWRRCG